MIRDIKQVACMSWSHPMLDEIELFGGSGQPYAVSHPVNRVQRGRFVDSWRGIFHAALIIDHLPVFVPGVFAEIAAWFEPVGNFSLAAGFVFVPGFVSGLVYARVCRKSLPPRSRHEFRPRAVSP
jgi:hypothetical protein